MTKVPDAHRMPKILVSIVGVGHEWTIQAVVGVKCGFNDNVQVEFFKKNDALSNSNARPSNSIRRYEKHPHRPTPT